MNRFLQACLCIFLFITSCEKNAEVQSENLQTTPASVGLNAELVLKLVNEKRSAGCNCGTTAMPPVAALKWNNLLAAAALAHSKDMDANNYFSHTSPDGRNAGDRITAAGYKWMAYGENIAAGQPTEQAVFDAWINSEGHCKNIMSAGFNELGAAKAGKYWTQEFGRQ